MRTTRGNRCGDLSVVVRPEDDGVADLDERQVELIDHASVERGHGGSGRGRRGSRRRAGRRRAGRAGGGARGRRRGGRGGRGRRVRRRCRRRRLRVRRARARRLRARRRSLRGRSGSGAAVREVPAAVDFTDVLVVGADEVLHQAGGEVDGRVRTLLALMGRAWLGRGEEGQMTEGDAPRP